MGSAIDFEIEQPYRIASCLEAHEGVAFCDRVHRVKDGDMIFRVDGMVVPEAEFYRRADAAGVEMPRGRAR